MSSIERVETVASLQGLRFIIFVPTVKIVLTDPPCFRCISGLFSFDGSFS